MVQARAEQPVTSLRLETLPGFDRIARSVWDELWRCDATATVFQTYSWYALWLEHYATDAEPRILLAWDGDRLVGACALCVRNQKRLASIRRHILTFVSSHSATHALDQGPLCAPEHEDAVLGLFAPAIAAMRGVDAVHFELHEKESRADRLLLLVAAATGRAVFGFPPSLSHVVTLPNSYEELLERLSWSRRRTLRKSCRKFHKNTERHEFKTTTTAAEYVVLLDAMQQQKGERFKEHGGNSTLDDTRFTAFLKDLSAAYIEEGMVLGWLALIDGEPAATELAFFDEHGHFYPYNTSFDQRFAKHRLNYIIETARFTAAIERGYGSLDLSTGFGDYKKHWTEGKGRQLFAGEVTLRPLANLPFRFLEMVKRVVKRS